MAQNITVTQGSIIAVTTSKRIDRNKKGIICSIPGNPDGYLPFSVLIGRTDEARAARMEELLVPGVQLEVVVTEAGIREVEGKKLPRISLNEFRVAAVRREQAEKSRNEALTQQLKDIVIGSIVDGVIDAPAETDSKKTPGTKHRFGHYVNIGDHTALLHVSELDGADFRAQNDRLAKLRTGLVVQVKIIDAKVEHGRILVAVSEKQAVAEQARGALTAGKKVTVRVIELDSVDDVHGVVVDISGVKGFLPEDDACVKDIAALTRSKGQTTKVIVTDETIGEFVKVTRKGV
jgi:ribosomal protein S1